MQTPVRSDFRQACEARKIKIDFSHSTRGHAEVYMGATHVKCAVSGEVVKPPAFRHSEGSIQFKVDFSGVQILGKPILKESIPHRAAILATMTESIFIQGHAINPEMLCITAGSLVWSIQVNLFIITDDGNLADAVMLAALAGLIHYRKYDPKSNQQWPPSHASTEISRSNLPTPLNLNFWPILRTFNLMNDSKMFCLDVDKEEEVSSLTAVSIAMNEKQELCAVKKYGEVAIAPESLSQLVSGAYPHIYRVIITLKDAIIAHELQRADRQRVSDPIKVIGLYQIKPAPVDESFASGVMDIAHKNIMEGENPATHTRLEDQTHQIADTSDASQQINPKMSKSGATFKPQASKHLDYDFASTKGAPRQHYKFTKPKKIKRKDL